jgi:hypothetical protein
VLVAVKRELVTRFEQTAQAALARIWGEEAPSAVVGPHSLPDPKFWMLAL